MAARTELVFTHAVCLALAEWPARSFLILFTKWRKEGTKEPHLTALQHFCVDDCLLSAELLPQPSLWSLYRQLILPCQSISTPQQFDLCKM